MLYDLNIAWTPATTVDDLHDLLAFSSSLGYDVIALNQTITPPILPNSKNSIPAVESPRRPSGPAGSAAGPAVLRRATVLLADASANFRLPTLQPLYDMVAVRPTTAQAFQSACLSLPDMALISLDLAAHLPFAIRPRPAMAAVERGVRFEICYAQFCAGAGASDPRARANFIHNATALVRATRGRGIVLSSGAGAAAGLRPPVDVANLAAVWGMGHERALEAVGATARAVVMNEKLKRTGFRGVVTVVRRADPAGVEGGQDDGIVVVVEGGGEIVSADAKGVTAKTEREDDAEASQQKDNGKRKHAGRDVSDASRGVAAKRAKKSRHVVGKDVQQNNAPIDGGEPSRTSSSASRPAKSRK